MGGKMKSGTTIMVSNPSVLTALTAIMTTLVTLVTMVFQFYIPATSGYFNFGESMVYLSALLFGPYVGAFAGGVGSMLADVLTGFVFYAPGTLVIKGVEGFTVGLLSKRLRSGVPAGRIKKESVAVGLGIGVALALLGLGGLEGNWLSVGFFIDPVIWVIISALVAVLISYVVYRSDASGAIIVISTLAGGILMVTGYFLYELPSLGMAAVAEIFPNCMQCVAGIAISLPIYRGVKQATTV
jgi:uncharacterized membrane protein